MTLYLEANELSHRLKTYERKFWIRLIRWDILYIHDFPFRNFLVKEWEHMQSETSMTFSGILDLDIAWHSSHTDIKKTNTALIF